MGEIQRKEEEEETRTAKETKDESSATKTDESWWTAVGTLAVRQAAEAEAERLADFQPGDAVRGLGLAVGDWQRVALDGAVRFDGQGEAPDEGGGSRACPAACTGFVRTRNKFRELLTPTSDTIVAAQRWAQQVKERAIVLDWFRPPPRSAATAAQYDRPLLQGGVEEFERRWEIQSTVNEIVAAQTSLRNYGPLDLKADLRERFKNSQWLEPMLAQRTVVASLMSTAISSLKPEQSNRELAPAETLQAKTCAPLAEATADILDIQHVSVAASSNQSLVSLNGALPQAAAPSAASVLALAELIDHSSSFTELLGWLPWADYPALASASCRIVAAVRGANWQRLVEVLVGEFGLLQPRLQFGYPSAPANRREWHAYFLELWVNRHKWHDCEKLQGFRVRALVRMRPRITEENAKSTSQIFLPLHQRLELVRLGHDTSFVEEVGRRMGALPTDTEAARTQDDPKDTHCCHARLLSIEEARVLVSLPGVGLRYFDFESVLDSHSAQGDVYKRAALPSVEAFLQGFSACIFCYGQTGSGKTHTMFGAEGAWDHAAPRGDAQKALTAQAGLAPRCLVDVMASVVAARERGVSSSVTVSYVEIYNDKITDLLSGRDVTLFRVGEGVAAAEYRASRQSGEEQLYQLQGAEVMEVCSAGEALTLLAAGERLKHRAATALNARSSRAHSIVMLSLTQRFQGHVLRSRLHLVDLGGSEQVKKSKAEGARFDEAVVINKSLLVLDRVVDALTQGRAHVPFYESKLTMLLQPALGGNARTTVLVTASPEDEHADETVHALRFGERCARLTNEAKASTASMAEVLASLDSAISTCEKEIASLEARGAAERALAELGDGRLRGAGFGHDGSRLAAQLCDDGTSGQEAVLRAQASGAYSEVEDVAGDWIAQQERLRALQQRRREILGK